jgi:hypothetical protein
MANGFDKVRYELLKERILTFILGQTFEVG